MKMFRKGKAEYKINGEFRYAYEIHLFRLTFLVYRKAKNCDKRFRIDRDEFFGTGTTACLFLPF